MVRKELNLSCLPSYKFLKNPTTAGIPTTISNNFLHRDPKAFSTWMHSRGLIWINGFQIIKTGFLTNTVPLRLNHGAISGSSHPILLQFKYAISQQKEGIVFNFICLYLWKKKKPPTMYIKRPGINTLFKGITQGSIFYFVIWKKVRLKAVWTACSKSKKALPVIPLGKSDPDLGKRYLATSFFPFLSVVFEVLCNVSSNPVGLRYQGKATTFEKHMLSQQNSEAKSTFRVNSQKTLWQKHLRNFLSQIQA